MSCRPTYSLCAWAGASSKLSANTAAAWHISPTEWTATAAKQDRGRGPRRQVGRHRHAHAGDQEDEPGDAHGGGALADGLDLPTDPDLQRHDPERVDEQHGADHPAGGARLRRDPEREGESDDRVLQTHHPVEDRVRDERSIPEGHPAPRTGRSRQRREVREPRAHPCADQEGRGDQRGTAPDMRPGCAASAPTRRRTAPTPTPAFSMARSWER